MQRFSSEIKALAWSLTGCLTISAAQAEELQSLRFESLLNLSLKELMQVSVVAQKREENLQDVPLSVYVLDRKRLESANVNRIDELSTLTPSLVYDKGIDYTKASMKIRGIGTLVFGAGVESSVATAVDGVVMSTGGAGLDDLPDVERVEILNGPQSTLFGKNASAGVIHVITRNPDKEKHSSEIQAMLTDDREYRVRYSTTGPINDALAYRFSAQGVAYDGNVKNRYTGEYLNGYDNQAARLKMSLQPSDTLALLLSMDYSQQKTDNGVRVLRQDSPTIVLDPAAVGQVGPIGSVGQQAGIVGSASNDVVNVDREPYNDTSAWGLSLQADKTLGDYVLTSLTAYRGWEQESNRDNDETPLPFSLMQLENRDTKWFSQEFRLASPVGKQYDYVLGAYYYFSDIFDRSGDDRTFSNAPYRYTYNLAKNTIETQNQALFGQLNWHANDHVTLFGGLRYLQDNVDARISRVSYTTNNPYLGNGATTTVEDVAPLDNSADDDVLVGKAGGKYRFSKQAMVYVSYSEGFKGAAFNTAFRFNADDFLNQEPVAPERSKSWEAGLRSDWLDDRLRVNATVFHTEFEGLHQTVRDLVNNRNIVGSVPLALSHGVELDISAQLLEDLTLYTGVSYLRATYDDFTLASCYARQTVALGCVNGAQDLSGETIFDSPEWKGVVGAQYQFPVGAVATALQANWRIQSETNLDTANNPAALQPGYGVLDLAWRASWLDHKLSAKLFVENIFDKQYISGVSVNGNAGGDVMMQVLPRDFYRYAGIAVDYQF